MLLDLMVRLSRRRWWPLLAGLGSWACGHDERPSAEELQALIAAHCEKVEACRCDGTVGADTCPDDLGARWNERVREGLRRGLVYDAECFARLDAQVQARGCEWSGTNPPICQSFCAVFVGDEAEGQACDGVDALVSDCQQGLVCREGTCTNPCAALGGRGRGEACANPAAGIGMYDDCAVGLFCGWQTSTCDVRAAEGESCGTRECLEDLECNYQTSRCEPRPPAPGPTCDTLGCGAHEFCDWRETGPICVPFATEGEPCVDRRCIDGLTCDQVCVAPRRDGEPCLFGSQCAEGHQCDFESTRCVALPGVGAPCLFGACEPDAWCQISTDDPEGTCSDRLANGEPCSGHSQCSSYYCPNGFCWAVPSLGDDCEGTQRCAPGLVCNGLTCEPTLTRAPAACSYPGW